MIHDEFMICSICCVVYLFVYLYGISVNMAVELTINLTLFTHEWNIKTMLLTKFILDALKQSDMVE